jgi:hypothetical protein
MCETHTKLRGWTMAGEPGRRGARIDECGTFESCGPPSALTRRAAQARLGSVPAASNYWPEATTMGNYPPYGPSSVGRRIDEAIELIEMELRHAAAYVNSAVIPQVRSESISALRVVANSLHQFADHLDKQAANRPAPPQPPQPPEAPSS